MIGLLEEAVGLVTFVRTVQTGSFSAAAKTLGATPSSVSKSVTRLEALVGAKLLLRSTRTLVLTAEGEAFYGKVEPLLSDLEKAADAVQSHDGVSGHLRVTLPGEMGRYLIGPIFNEFMRSYPAISLEVSMSDRHIDVLRDRFDIAFRVGNPEQSGLMSRKLGDLEMVLVAAPSFMKTHPDVRSIHDLIELPFARYVIDGRAYPIRFSGGMEIQPKGRVDLDSASGIREAAISGLGAAHLLKRVVQEDIDNGSLVILLPDFRLEKVPLISLHAYGRMPNRKMQLLIDFVAHTVRSFR